MNFNREQHGCVKMENEKQVCKQKTAGLFFRFIFCPFVVQIIVNDEIFYLQQDFSLSGLVQKRDFICTLFPDTLEIPRHFHYFILHFIKLGHALAEGLQHFL